MSFNMPAREHTLTIDLLPRSTRTKVQLKSVSGAIRTLTVYSEPAYLADPAELALPYTPPYPGGVGCNF